MEWLGYMLILYLTFCEIAQLFSRVVTPFYIPISNVWRFSIDFKIFILYVTILLNNLFFCGLSVDAYINMYSQFQVIAFQIKLPEVLAYVIKRNVNKRKKCRFI